MRALGELLLSKAGYQSFTDIAEDYLGPRAAYITGWTYWFCWIMTAMADVIAVGVYVQYWFDIPQWVPAVICLIILLGLNLLTVKSFGELEFWFALIKVVTILALIGLGIVLLVTQFKTDAGSVSVRNLWEHGGVFPNGVKGFLFSFQMVVFAYVGVELVGVSAAETANPEKTSRPRSTKFRCGFSSSMSARCSCCCALIPGPSLARLKVRSCAPSVWSGFRLLRGLSISWS